MSFVNSLFLLSNVLAPAVYSIPHPGHLSKRCTNSATDRSCWGDFDLSTNYYEVSPDTGVTREVCTYISQTGKKKIRLRCKILLLTILTVLA